MKKIITFILLASALGMGWREFSSEDSTVSRIISSVKNSKARENLELQLPEKEFSVRSPATVEPNQTAENASENKCENFHTVDFLTRGSCLAKQLADPGVAENPKEFLTSEIMQTECLKEENPEKHSNCVRYLMTVFIFYKGTVQNENQEMEDLSEKIIKESRSPEQVRAELERIQNPGSEDAPPEQINPN